MKGIFTTRIEPTYDDVPEERYHFGARWLNAARKTVGDFILYYEPRRTGATAQRGRMAYFATARVDRVEADPKLPGYYYAHVADFLEFVRPVPLLRRLESATVKEDGSTNKGLTGISVRTLPDQEYEAILAEGMGASMLLESPRSAWTLQEDTAPFVREIRETVFSRKVRDQAFGLLVRDAYDATCAFTGLRLINGGGRSEIEAAHIQPVGGEHAGPDSVRNGLALSRTLHWMFDRGLMSLEDDGKILMAKRRGDDALDRVRRLLHSDGYARLPDDARMRPHGKFLRYHREAIFKE